MKTFSVNDFKIKRFFSYTSTVPSKDRVFYLDGMNRYNKYPNIQNAFDDFYRDLQEKAEKTWTELTGNEVSYFLFRDNKTVFQIENLRTGQNFFVGRYDGYRFVGTSCFLYDGHIVDFEKKIYSDYLHNIKCEGGTLYQQFTLTNKKE